VAGDRVIHNTANIKHIGGIFFGYDVEWAGGVLAMPYFIRQHTGMTYMATPCSRCPIFFSTHSPEDLTYLNTEMFSCGTLRFGLCSFVLLCYF
jgi:hypothetical protein